MAENTEREDLEALIGSAGWRRLSEATTTEYEGLLRRGILQALGEAEDRIGLDKLRQIQAAKIAVEWVLAFPHNRLRTLAGSEEAHQVTGNRRGRL